MTPQELDLIASAAYGDDWKTPLAVEMNITRETLWRYATGRTAVPDYYHVMIRRICKRAIEQKMQKLNKALAVIAKAKELAA